MSNKPIIDFRDYPRIESDVIIFIEYKKNPISILGWLINISLTGCLIQTYFDFEEKTIINIKFYYNKKEINTKARIIRKSFDGKTYYYGIRFIIIQLFLKRKIKKYQKWLQE